MVLHRVSAPPTASYSSDLQMSRRSNLLRQDLELVQNAFVVRFDSTPASGQVIRRWAEEMYEVFSEGSWRTNLVDNGKWTVLTRLIQVLTCLIQQHYLAFDKVSYRDSRLYIL